MNTEIILPLWVFLLLLLAAVWSVLDRIFIPSIRWFLRRRINRVIDEIGSRLNIEIRPFQLTKRQVLIDRLVYDPKVIESIQAYAQENDTPREVIQAKVLTYAKEIVPAFNAYLYFRIGYWIAKKVAHLLYDVRIDLINNEQLTDIKKDTTVIFVMNHRSNMDYILISFLVAEKATLSYAVGEWARIWPLQTLIRAMGAFFVRRNSGNPLYRRVLERYIHMATKEGVCQAVFLEGGLSRDGRVRPPKFGLIDYMMRNYNHETDRDIIFIPIGLNYDRSLEDRSLVRTLDPDVQKRSRWFVVKTTVGFVYRCLLFRIRNKWRRFGYACVNFGPLISAGEYCRQNNINMSRLDQEDRFKVVERLCHRLMESIEKIVPVIPLPLVSAVFLKDPHRSMTSFEVETEVHRLISKIREKGAPVYVPKRSRAQSILTTLNMMKIRRLIESADDRFKASEDAVDILAYYANSIDHWLNDGED
jgi:glycerol-3-phosphate O-acyltransferase